MMTKARNIQKRVMVGLAACLVIAVGTWWLTAKAQRSCEQVTLTACIQLERATTDAARTKGLSGRPSLPANSGLLFVFAAEDTHGIWMKDMFFPIDIIWSDRDRKVVDIERDVTPLSYPQVFQPSKPARYVLELPAGGAQAAGIEIGAQLLFKP